MVQAGEETERQDLPQAMMLLDEMNENVVRVSKLVDDMLVRVRNGEITTDSGLSFLEVKYHTLLGYLIDLTYVVLRKCSGERVEGDPAIDRLVEIRTVLEKIRPIDQKLKYQIDKLVKGASSDPERLRDDPSAHRPRPDQLVGRRPEDLVDPDVGPETAPAYVPPRFAAAHYDGDDTPADREKRRRERERRRALNSSVVRELRDEVLDTPVEIPSGDRARRAISRKERERTEYEENHMTRLPVTKAEKHKRRRVTTVANVGDEIIDFGDYSALDESTGRSGVAKKKKRKIGRKKGRGGKRIRFH